MRVVAVVDLRSLFDQIRGGSAIQADPVGVGAVKSSFFNSHIHLGVFRSRSGWQAVPDIRTTVYFHTQIVALEVVEELMEERVHFLTGPRL